MRGKNAAVFLSLFALSLFALSLTALSLTALSSMTAMAQPARPPGPCQQILAACRDAGFERGGARSGAGIVADCVRPIMRGGGQRRRATKPAPQIDPQVVEACRARNPTFGQGKKSPPGAVAPPPAAQPPQSPAETAPPAPGAAPPR